MLCCFGVISIWYCHALDLLQMRQSVHDRFRNEKYLPYMLPDPTRSWTEAVTVWYRGGAGAPELLCDAKCVTRSQLHFGAASRWMTAWHQENIIHWADRWPSTLVKILWLPTPAPAHCIHFRSKACIAADATALKLRHIDPTRWPRSTDRAGVRLSIKIERN